MIGRQRQGEDDEDDEDEREGETLFAGGERRCYTMLRKRTIMFNNEYFNSGLSVQNPGRGGGPGGVVRDLLRKAAQFVALYIYYRFL